MIQLAVNPFDISFNGFADSLGLKRPLDTEFFFGALQETFRIHWIQEDERRRELAVIGNHQGLFNQQMPRKFQFNGIGAHILAGTRL